MERYKYATSPLGEERYAYRCTREEQQQDVDNYAKRGFRRVIETMPTGLRISRYEKIHNWKDPKLNVKA